MEIPEEIETYIIALSVVDSSILFIWAHYPKIQYYIGENKDLNWKSISSDQKLPECFIRAFKYNLDWGEIFFNQELSKEFLSIYKNPNEKHSWRYEKIPSLNVTFLKL
jgi:hypothetical protein